MIYVFPCGSIVYDGRTLSEEDKSRAVEVATIPKPESIPGKYPVLKADKENELVFYEYEDIPADPEIEQLKQTVADLIEYVLLLGGEN